MNGAALVSQLFKKTGVSTPPLLNTEPGEKYVLFSFSNYKNITFLWGCSYKIYQWS